MSEAPDSDTETLSSSIGIVGVLALLVGNAISVPIFVLPGPLAGTAGPALILAIILAAVPASFVVLYNAVLGSAMPVAGGLYVYISRLTAPYWGFLVFFPFAPFLKGCGPSVLLNQLVVTTSAN